MTLEIQALTWGRHKNTSISYDFSPFNYQGSFVEL